MPTQTAKHDADAIRALEQSAVRLLTSLKGVEAARVQFDEAGALVRVAVVPNGIDDRSAMRNVQSALMAVMGISLDINAIAIVNDVKIDPAPVSVPAPAAAPAVVVGVPEPAPAVEDGILELKIPPLKSGELNVAARVAFDTLRTAQSSFHGFQFDGAELVKIGAQQYVVVAVRHAASDARHCGAAPVAESVSTASARALMNAVGTAAMGGSALHVDLTGGRELLEA